jgi:hypothetical protein
VDVTEDHSLLLEDGTKVTPGEVQVGTKLLHSDVGVCCRVLDASPTAREAEDMGISFGDGESSGAAFYNSAQEKVVPACILNAELDVIQAFWTGYCKADSDHHWVKGKEGSLGLFVICRMLGYNVSIDTHLDKPGMFVMTCSRSEHCECPTAIKKIEYLGETECYVYDLTTLHGHFHVGPGELVVHNTDSVMFRFLTLDPDAEGSLQHAFERGEQLARVITLHLQDRRVIEIAGAAPSIPTERARISAQKVVLEFEKTLESFILLSKKKYAALCRELDWRNPPKTLIKGLDLARRTVSRTVIHKTKSVLQRLLDSRDPQVAHNLMTECARSLLGSAGLDPNDSTLYYSTKLNHQYKKRATFRSTGSVIKGDAVVKFDGTWSPACEVSAKAGGAKVGDTLKCVRKAYSPWELYDAAGKPVGHISFSEPHVHAALDDEEDMPGSGPRPGDRVFYSYLSEPHPKATSTVLAFDGRPAFCYSKAKTASAIRDKGLTLLVDKYYNDYVSGVSSFMSVACESNPTSELQHLGRERRALAQVQFERANARAKKDESVEAGVLSRQWNAANGQHSIGKFFASGGGAWLPRLTVAVCDDAPSTKQSPAPPKEPSKKKPVPKKAKKGAKEGGVSILDMLRKVPKSA